MSALLDEFQKAEKESDLLALALADYDEVSKEPGYHFASMEFLRYFGDERSFNACLAGCVMHRRLISLLGFSVSSAFGPGSFEKPIREKLERISVQACHMWFVIDHVGVNEYREERITEWRRRLEKRVVELRERGL